MQRALKPLAATAVLVLAAVAGLTATSCSENPPTIDQTILQRIVRLEARSGTIRQSLALFCAVSPTDAAKNLSSIYLLNDNLQLLWCIGPDQVERLDIAARQWTGNSSLELAPGEPAPNGQFRVVLYDRSGNRAEAAAQLPRLEADVLALVPRARRDQGNLVISPARREGLMVREIVVKDWSGAQQARWQVLADTIPLSALEQGLPPGEHSYWICDTWSDENLICESGPW